MTTHGPSTKTKGPRTSIEWPRYTTPKNVVARCDVDVIEPHAGTKPGGLTNLTNSTTRAYDPGMARVLNLYEAKSQLSALVEEAAAGAEIVIAKAGVPRARLVPLPSHLRRRPGGSQERIWISRNFDEPLPDNLVAAFERRRVEHPRGRIRRRGPKR
jgi:prevent-host-death family protein